MSTAKEVFQHHRRGLFVEPQIFNPHPSRFAGSPAPIQWARDPIGGDAEQTGVATVGNGALMQRIGAVENGEKEKRVREDGLHFRGRPWR